MRSPAPWVGGWVGAVAPQRPRRPVHPTVSSACWSLSSEAPLPAAAHRPPRRPRGPPGARRARQRAASVWKVVASPAGPCRPAGAFVASSWVCKVGWGRGLKCVLQSQVRALKNSVPRLPARCFWGAWVGVPAEVQHGAAAGRRTDLQERTALVSLHGYCSACLKWSRDEGAAAPGVSPATRRPAEAASQSCSSPPPLPSMALGSRVTPGLQSRAWLSLTAPCAACLLCTPNALPGAAHCEGRPQRPFKSVALAGHSAP